MKMCNKTADLLKATLIQLFFINSLFCCYSFVFAQDIWLQKADFSGISRRFAVGFSIGTKGYIGTGTDSSLTELKDFWEWDQATNTWTQKADFPGLARKGAVGFSIGTKGYIGTGTDSSLTELKDFWEWDQATNTWTQKADFAGGPRLGAVGFSIGTKGYIGTGYSNSVYYNDLWEWDQNNNNWIKKASFDISTSWNAQQWFWTRQYSLFSSHYVVYKGTKIFSNQIPKLTIDCPAKQQ